MTVTQEPRSPDHAGESEEPRLAPEAGHTLRCAGVPGAARALHSANLARQLSLSAAVIVVLAIGWMALARPGASGSHSEAAPPPGGSVTVCAAALILAWGVLSFLQLPIEAYPDVMNTQVHVITQWPGHAAEEVEKLITVRLKTSLNGVPRVQSLRSRSLFGLSTVDLSFHDG